MSSQSRGQNDGPPARSPETAAPQHRIGVAAPYRLDLTVSVLRRLSTNLVDVIAPTGEYCRVLDGVASGNVVPIVAHVRQSGAETLVVTLNGGDLDQQEVRRALKLLRRSLGVDRDLAHFDHAAAAVPWLAPVARRMRGVKPPRYQSLWEAFVNSILFQQVSLLAASAIMARLITALSDPTESDGTRLYPFPTVNSFLSARHEVLRGAGLSESKLATLRRVGEGISGGTLDEQTLEELPSADVAARLREIKGIGPWTAALVLLRGLGRLDVFPANDTSVARNLAMVSGSAEADIDATVKALSPQQGMLYYHLLLARLESRGELGQPSESSTATAAG